MTIQEFNQLPLWNQKTLAYLRGCYLATRWQEGNEAVRLFSMPEGFFVKLAFDNAFQVQRLCAFEAGSEDDRLLYHAMLVKLPGWMPETE